SAGQGRAERGQVPGRPDHPQGDRGAGQDRQHRRRVAAPMLTARGRRRRPQPEVPRGTSGAPLLASIPPPALRADSPPTWGAIAPDTWRKEPQPAAVALA